MARSLQSVNNLFSGFGYIWQKVGVDWRESTRQSVIFGSLSFLDTTLDTLDSFLDTLFNSGEIFRGSGMGSGDISCDSPSSFPLLRGGTEAQRSFMEPEDR